MQRLNSISLDADNLPAEVNASKFFMRSVGRAAINLKMGSHLLEVVPLEEVGYIDGELNDERETIEVGGTDAEGNSFNVKMETSNAIEAQWLPLATNRITPPNIRRGERVLLWQYGDTDKYYWTPTGLDEDVRRLETVVFRISNTIDEADKTITPDNSYWYEMSTHRKHVTLSTSKSNGEAFKYTIQVDTENSRVTICDDIDNFIELSSAEKKITVCNSDDSYVVLDKKNIDINAKSTINITAPNVNIKATNAKISASSTSVEGGTASMSGTYNVLGNVTFGKPVAFTSAVTSNGKDISSSHRHSNSGGPGTGGPVT